MIQIYTGNGKGKTTAALGLALRALGWGKRVALIQFLKQNATGEARGLARFKDCEIRQFGRDQFITRQTAEAIDHRLAKEGFARAEEIVRVKDVDLLILDEINVALDLNLLDLDRVRGLIERCPPEIELIMTGRDAPPGIISLADYVSEIKEIKHPYRNGTTARKGVEY